MVFGKKKNGKEKIFVVEFYDREGERKQKKFTDFLKVMRYVLNTRQRDYSPIIFTLDKDGLKRI